MGIIFSSSALNREDAMIEATRAAVAAGHPSDVEGAGAYEARTALKYGVDDPKKEKKLERKQKKKEEKARKEAQKVQKVRNDPRGRVDLLQGEEAGPSTQHTAPPVPISTNSLHDGVGAQDVKKRVRS